jgi:hypothetical protein
MEVVHKEIHYYSSANTFYEFDKGQYAEYQVMLVEGFLANVWHTFVQETDYELFNNGLRWLPNNNTPEPPPSTISTAGNIPFEISYVYEVDPVSALINTVYPFIDEKGTYIAIIRAFGAQIERFYGIKNGVLEEHDLTKANGNELDYLGTWYNVTRVSDESDEALRGRLLEFLESYVSSGTVNAIIAAVESYTGTPPTITELWRSISYFNYNIDDYNDPSLSPDQWRTYLFAGGTPDNVYTFQAYFYDPLSQLNTFLCILPYAIITEYGLTNIKRIVRRSKAAGVQGYVGWLVNESFENLDDWEVVI